MAIGRSQSVGTSLGRIVVENGDRVGTGKGENILGLLELFKGPFSRDSDWLCGKMVGWSLPFSEFFFECKLKTQVRE